MKKKNETVTLITVQQLNIKPLTFTYAKFAFA